MHDGQGYVRGTSCSYVRDHGNLHGILGPLRKAVYVWLGAPGQVHEMYPEWNPETKDVKWVDEPLVNTGGNVNLRILQYCKTLPAIFMTRMVSPTVEEIPKELLDLETDPDNPELALRALRWLEGQDPSFADAAGRTESKERTYARCFLLAELLQSIPGASREVLEILRQISGRRLEESSKGGGWPPGNYLKAVQLEIVCSERSCRTAFSVAPKEQLWFESKGYSLPKRCKTCRAKRQTIRQ
eukprot:scaffold215438_cov32-Prasinocladus_malaysianus.AAC.1